MDWCDNIGFGLWECIIYHKNGRGGAAFANRFRIDHEYILIFAKGSKPKYFNKSANQIPCKLKGRVHTSRTYRRKDGNIKQANGIINDTKCIGTVWYLPSGKQDKLKHQHPGTFHDAIPYNMIRAFTEPGDLVLDPMVGSGTTAIAALSLDRHFLGIDISKDYCELARQRVDEYARHNQ